MKKPIILLLETIASEAKQLLDKNAIVLEANFPEDYKELTMGKKIDGVITRGKGQINKDLFNHCSDLKVVVRCGVGLDNFDLDEMKKRSISVLNTPGINSQSVAEHAIAFILMMHRMTYQTIKETKGGNWNYRNVFDGDEVQKKTLGVIGLGNIGQKVSYIANALKMKIIGWDPYQKELPSYINHCKEINDLLKHSDIISLHVPLLEGTKDLICSKTIKWMRNSVQIVNTARSEIVNQKDLLNALNDKKISMYSADVLNRDETYEDLLSHRCTLITPHVASLTKATYDNMCLEAVNKMIQFFRV